MRSGFLINYPGPTKRRLVVKRDPYHEVSRNINNLINSHPTCLMIGTYHVVGRKFFINY
jgi:hypothetical protein